MTFNFLGGIVIRRPHFSGVDGKIFRPRAGLSAHISGRSDVDNSTAVYIYSEAWIFFWNGL